MITGIQITKAANDDLLNSFWLLDEEKQQARCICARATALPPIRKSASPTWVNSNTVNCRFSKSLWSKGVST